MQLHEIAKKHQKIWVCDDVMPDFRQNWFDIQSADSSHIWSKERAGRQAIQKFAVNNRQYVLRHYCRGGLPAHITKDRFIFRGWKATRAYRELKILLEMSQLGLPVPFPAAARCITGRITYSADIIMVEIPDSESLANVLTQRKFTSEEWQSIGATIRRFHRFGIEHVDLNANNILIGHDGNIHLIDFDRCVRRPYKKSWARAGISRLRRSLKKLKNANEDLFYESTEFRHLLDGYRE